MRSTVWLPLFAVALALLWWGASQQPRVPGTEIKGWIEPEVRAAIAPFGGKVVAVLAKSGDHVSAGQSLVRLEAQDLSKTTGQAREAMERLLRVPDAVWKQAEQDDPERKQGDAAYIAALGKWEQTKSPAAEKLLRHAIQQRESAYRKVSPFSKKAFEDWQQNLGVYEVRAEQDGRVEILNLKRGDLLPAPSKAALIANERRSVLRAPNHGSWRKGDPLRVRIGEQRLNAVVERVEAGQLEAFLEGAANIGAGQVAWIQTK
ncbi:MAG: biotin/lipoyl-binding protein [Bryobacteraceae bacterium]